jgi:hypothetical protein
VRNNVHEKKNLVRAAALVMTGAVAMACGGSSSEPKSTNIKSMPAYPDKSADQGKADAKPEPAKPKDLKTICKDAGDVKTSRTFSLPDEKDDHVSAATSFKAKKGPYSMADLSALEKKGAWEELLQHAEDIPPAQRSAAWEKTVEKAAIGYMEQLSGNTAAFEAVFTSQALLTRYPHLLKSQELMNKRSEAGKKASEQCLRDSYRGQHCIEMMRDFLKTSNTSPETGMAFGKITRRNQNHYVAVPFFKWALDQKKDAAMCGDEDLQLAVVAGLGLPPDYENAVSSRKISADACWDQFKPVIEKKLVEEGSGYFLQNACAVMKQKGAL